MRGKERKFLKKLERGRTESEECTLSPFLWTMERGMAAKECSFRRRRA
jgi:hypothetical protein